MEKARKEDKWNNEAVNLLNDNRTDPWIFKIYFHHFLRTLMNRMRNKNSKKVIFHPLAVTLLLTIPISGSSQSPGSRQFNSAKSNWCSRYIILYNAMGLGGIIYTYTRIFVPLIFLFTYFFVDPTYE